MLATSETFDFSALAVPPRARALRALKQRGPPTSAEKSNVPEVESGLLWNWGNPKALVQTRDIIRLQSEHGREPFEVCALGFGFRACTENRHEVKLFGDLG